MSNSDLEIDLDRSIASLYVCKRVESVDEDRVGRVDECS
jgi:hypothetical protein